MLINIELPTDVKEKLDDKARHLGKALEDLIIEILEETAAAEEVKKRDHLLQKVTLGIDPKKWERYYQLIAVRDEEQLTEEQHKELIAISDEIEMRNAERMPYVFQLAALEGTQPELIIEQLNIQ